MLPEEAIDERYQIIKDIFVDVTFNKSKDEALIFCPKHEHRKKKLSINVNKNKFQCWVCGYSGNIKKLLSEHAQHKDKIRYLKTLGIKIESQDLEKTEIELPREYKFILSSEKTPSCEAAKRFIFNDLKLSVLEVLQNKIGFCEDGPYSGRIIFPSFDRSGKLNYFTTRRFDGGTYKKYLNCEKSKSSIVFNELFIDWRKPIIIVEGVKSYIKHFSIGNIVPILGSSLYENSKIFEEIIMNDCKRIYVCLDPDAKEKAINLCRTLASNGLEAYLVDCPRQPDELDTKELINCINKSIKKTSNDLFLDKILMA
jgi:DNA primase